MIDFLIPFILLQKSSSKKYKKKFSSNNPILIASLTLNNITANIATFLTGSDVVNNDDVPQDDDRGSGIDTDCPSSGSYKDIGCGHGSHVAGLIASENNGSFGHGIAYDATLHIIKVLDDEGSGTFADIATGMDLARGVSSMDIVNISIGNSGVIGSSCDSASSCETHLGSTIYTAMEALGAAEIIQVYAAGNAATSHFS